MQVFRFPSMPSFLDADGKHPAAQCVVLTVMLQSDNTYIRQLHGANIVFCIFFYLFSLSFMYIAVKTQFTWYEWVDNDHY